MFAHGLFLLLLPPLACAGERAETSAPAREAMVRLLSSYAPAHRVTDERVLAAMRKVPRHLFVPEPYTAQAYENTPLPIGEEQTISQPFIVGYMTQALELKRSDRVLEIGTGSGYQAAILAEIITDVYTIEILPGLARRAQAVLSRLGYRNVKVKVGDGYLGWPQAAPFDAIIVTCAPDHIPQPLVSQLKMGGRMVIPVGPDLKGSPWSPQELIVLRKTPRGMEREKRFDVRFVTMTGQALRKRPQLRGLYGFNPSAEIFRGLSPSEVAARLSRWGVNAVFLKSESPALRKALRAAEIKIFRTLTCFAGEDHWKTHPESRPINAAGLPIKKIKWYAGVCPNQGWLRARLLEKISRLAADGPDGIWLDFIRYPAHWEVLEPALEETCFCPVCLAGFENRSGLKLPAGTTADKARWILKNHASAWAGFKARTITEFVAEASSAVRAATAKTGREVTLGLFAVPWTAQERDGAVRRALGQDFEALSPHVDVFSPMLYHQLIGREASWMTEVVAYFRSVSAKPVWPILYSGDRARPLSAAELERSLDIVGAKADGVLLLSFSGLLETGRLKTLEGAWGDGPPGGGK